MIKLLYYLDVLSSWCFYAEPNLARLLERYGSRVSYDWRIALITENMPGGNTLEQVEWYYKRSGGISGIRLNSGWRQGPHSTLDANLAAEAARDLGFTDDRVRLALARAALLEGMPIYHKTMAADVVSAVTGLEPERILTLMDDVTIRERIRRSGEEFAALGIDQRPGFVLRSAIGDTAIFSGLWTFEPLEATIGAMLSDGEKYEKFAANNPPLPARH